MGKNNKLSENKLRIEIEKAIKANKTNKASKLAKTLAKEYPSEQNNKIRCETSLKHATALFNNKMEKEAIGLIENCKDKYPEYLKTILQYEKNVLFNTYSVEDLLKELHEIGENKKLFNLLSQKITNPRDLLKSQYLKESDILYKEAKIIDKLFYQVTSQPISKYDLKSLQDIHSESPLLPWKLAIRSIYHLYNQEYKQMIKNLKMIPDNTPPAQWKNIIMMISYPDKSKYNPNLSFYQKALIDKIIPSKNNFHAKFKKLDFMFDNDFSFNKVKKIFINVCQDIEKEKPEIIPLFLATSIFKGLESGFPILPFINDKFLFYGSLSQAEQFKYQNGAESIVIWTFFLEKFSKNKKYSINNIEQTIILLEILQIVIQMKNSFGFHRILEEYEEEFRDTVKYFDKRINKKYKILDQVKTQYDFFAVKNILAIIDTYVDSNILKEITNILENGSLRLNNKNITTRLINEVIDVWHNYSPTNPKPILIKIQNAIKNKSYKKAEKLVLELKNIDSLNPNLILLEIEIYINNIVKHLRVKKYHLIYPILEKLKFAIKDSNGYDHIITFFENILYYNNKDNKMSPPDKILKSDLIYNFLAIEFPGFLQKNIINTDQFFNKDQRIEKFIPEFLEIRKVFLSYNIDIENLYQFANVKLKKNKKMSNIDEDSILQFLQSILYKIEPEDGLYLSLNALHKNGKYKYWFLFFIGFFLDNFDDYDDYDDFFDILDFDDLMESAYMLAYQNKDRELMKFISKHSLIGKDIINDIDLDYAEEIFETTLSKIYDEYIKNIGCEYNLNKKKMSVQKGLRSNNKKCDNYEEYDEYDDPEYEQLELF